MAINQETLQGLTQLMGIVPDVMETVSGLTGIQQGLEQTAQSRAQGQRDISRLQSELQQANTASIEMKNRTAILKDQLKVSQEGLIRDKKRDEFEEGQAQSKANWDRSQYFERWDATQRSMEYNKKTQALKEKDMRIAHLHALLSGTTLVKDSPNYHEAKAELFWLLGLDYMPPNTVEGGGEGPERSPEDRAEALRASQEVHLEQSGAGMIGGM